MAGKWTGGVVESGSGDDPPIVDEWRTVPVPGRPSGLADADGPVAYRTRFDDPRTDGDERAILELGGVYGQARVWVNGTRRDVAGPYFVPTRFEFEPRQENELFVVCEPPASVDGIYDTAAVPDDLAVPGIWWDVSIEARPATFLREMAATPRLSDDGAAVDVEIEVDAGEAIDDAVTLSLRPEGVRGAGSMERTRVAADAGERVRVSKTLEIRNPSLWWPREFGPQARYAIRAKLGDDVAERTVGLRTIERDEDGLLVNGRRVRARGFTRLPGGDEREDVRRAVDANATIVRPQAHVPSRDFYAACDEAGLLVWQDLPTSGPDLDVDRGIDLATTLVEEYGTHPSLAMYGVQTTTVDPFEEPLGSGRLAKLAVRWRAWRTDFDGSDAETVAAALPEDVPVVPVTGPLGVDPDAAILGLGWQYLEASDVDWLLERYPSLSSAVGGFGPASLSSERVDPDRVPGVDGELLERRVETAAQSRTYQARSTKTIAEALRRRGCGIVVASPLRDAAPGGGPGVLTTDGAEKPAYRAMATAYEPVQAVLESPPAPGTVGLSLVNDTRERVETTVRWWAGENDGERRVDAGPLEVADAGGLEIPTDASEVRLELSVGGRTVDNRYRL